MVDIESEEFLLRSSSTGARDVSMSLWEEATINLTLQASSLCMGTSSRASILGHRNRRGLEAPQYSQSRTRIVPLRLGWYG